jgi:hypothetical protein
MGMLVEGGKLNLLAGTAVLSVREHRLTVGNHRRGLLALGLAMGRGYGWWDGVHVWVGLWRRWWSGRIFLGRRKVVLRSVGHGVWHFEDSGSW